MALLFALLLSSFISISHSYTDVPPAALQNDLLAVEDLEESDNKLDEWYDINQAQFIESGASLVRFGSISPPFRQKFKANFNLDILPSTDSVVFKYSELDEISMPDLMQELQIQNRMNHIFNKHVPRIYHWFKEKNKIIFAMESGGKAMKFVHDHLEAPGQFLQIAVDNSEIVAKKRVCSLLMQMFPVLRYMNQAGIHHRDLKIDNLLFNDGIWNMIDFGSAQLMYNMTMDSFEFELRNKYTSSDIMTALTFHFEHTANNEVKNEIFEMLQQDPITNDLPALIVSAFKMYLLTIEHADKRLFERVHNVFDPYAFITAKQDKVLYSEHSCIHSISMNQDFLLSLVQDSRLRELFNEWMPEWSDEESAISDHAKYKNLHLFQEDLSHACLD